MVTILLFAAEVSVPEKVPAMVPADGSRVVTSIEQLEGVPFLEKLTLDAE